MRIAALTMMHNEPVWARIWVRHYAEQVGAENCLVLDHGSTDGSARSLGVSVERVARVALDEDWRAAKMSEVADALLRGGYGAVVHSDVDELIVADPSRFDDLRSFAAQAAEVSTAIGLDLQHLPDEEPSLQVGQRVGLQRRWVRFSGAMCKPCVIRRGVAWTPGFHGCDAERSVDGLYLIHLRYADLVAGLSRLARTRSQAFARDSVNPHQRVPDVVFEEMMRSVARLPRVAGQALADLAAPWMAQMRDGWERGDAQLGLAGTALWELPEPVRTVL